MKIMKIKEDNIKQDLIFYFLLITLFCYLLSQGAILHPDSIGYLNFDELRGVGYSIFLNILLKNEFLIIFVQLAFGFYAALNVSNSLLKELKLKEKFLKYISVIIILIPYVFFLKFGNSILTEGICYPLFLFSIKYLFLYVVDKEKIYKFLAFSILLYVTRKQFLFLYPSAFFLILIKNYFYSKKIIKPTLLLVLCLIIGVLFEHTGQFVKSGNFKSIPFSGVHFVVAPLYVSKKSDAELFTGVNKKIFLDVYNEMNELGLLYSIAINPGHKITYLTETDLFHKSFDGICYNILQKNLFKNNITNYYEIENITSQMAHKLIIANFKNFFMLYVKKIIVSLGGYEFAFVLISMTCFFMYGILKKKDNFFIFLLTILILNFANIGLVSLVHIGLKRYTLYTNILLLLGICYIFYNLIEYSFRYDITNFKKVVDKNNAVV